MDNDIITPAIGERAAMGGYLPQYDEFAHFVYSYLINKELEWVSIADPDAEKLDDIQYSIYTEVHAYQVKWTISDANISYVNFKNLLPLLASSWQRLKSSNLNKRVFPHLLTNKSLSTYDKIMAADIKIGSFHDFFFEAWEKIKANQPIDKKWEPIILELKEISNLEDSEFNAFIDCFDFQPNYKQKSCGDTERIP
ncbi:MAG: hypothetical protein LBG19_11385 [Prevotellaceae bacterium]|jgi:hypothetical protein|nr:hypothetical protein [Prevotellaceae bacterium]